ncbi:hypothetical protein PoB_000269100 [Plakobranchus ocellatus]|uniref:Uncharacterized protein n=1 Tax=Plakobranchus ocellatus TaxID=259542 RepID=A0AAV3XZC9_9GAST|nr:hypothetical protein PoB_000269100 [Plakobranchus ocellatus]
MPRDSDCPQQDDLRLSGPHQTKALVVGLNRTVVRREKDLSRPDSGPNVRTDVQREAHGNARDGYLQVYRAHSARLLASRCYKIALGIPL